MELLKAIAMMAVIGIVAYQTIKDKLPLILTFYNIPLYTAIAAVGNILVDMGISGFDKTLLFHYNTNVEGFLFRGLKKIL